ncbi:flagellar protein G [Natronosalvus halobius]|uniref:flagellar protein G n=1 Tax=Natronosalvus halobius TaxID=2953746 RepID=UPI00209EEA19|nr:flagellar protein G [Natronosalvus halobius]USZ70445.1 flagellar protein G [Natronosalvus halobius]
MASESVSTLILFIAAMLVAAGIAGTLVANVNELSNSIDTQSSSVKQEIDTDIEIISDAGSNAVYNDSEGEERITLLVKNTGKRTLPTDGANLDVLVDGTYIQSDGLEVSVLTAGPTWRRGEVAELVVAVDGGLDPGDHRVVVDVGGDREVFEFYL